MFAVSKKRHKLVFEWITEIIKLVQANELPTDQLDKLLAIGFLTRKPNSNKATDTGHDTEKGNNSSDDDDEDENQAASIKDVKWNEKFEELIEYCKVHGHFSMPSRAGSGDRSLNNWVYFQRQRYREKKLATTKIKKLESIGFTWEASKKSAAKEIEYIIHFVQEKDIREEKPVEVPEPDPVINPSEAYVRPKDDIKATSTNEQIWYRRFLELVEYAEIYGHARIRVPKENDPWRALYFWLEAQKQYFRKNKLSRSRAQSLRNLGVKLKLPTRKVQGETPSKEGRTSLDNTVKETEFL